MKDRRFQVVPEDIRNGIIELAKTTQKTARQIGEVFDIDRTTVNRIIWRAGLSGRPVEKVLASTAKARDVPEGFAKDAVHMNNKDLAAKYQAGTKLVARWRKVVGVPSKGLSEAGKSGAAARWKGHQKVEAQPRPRRQRTFFRKMSAPDTPGNQDGSLARRAVDECLARHMPVWRCNKDGRTDYTGKFWRYGRNTMTDDQIVEKAISKGWNADKWKEVRV